MFNFVVRNFHAVNFKLTSIRSFAEDNENIRKYQSTTKHENNENIESRLTL